ncbi:hypothetical protein DP116_17740 [Brasilonema bromeliae SPC951]|uniref:Uncharacterized protein n=1 Tax=Brasilonema bromeliae SPC951 TaxID=385972 RepID=A0ABX1PBF0_9CYAN|nr:hypothetical protein [Brasilonema bromeliae SPC951]
MALRQRSLEDFVRLGELHLTLAQFLSSRVARACLLGIRSVRALSDGARVCKCGEQALWGIACRKGSGHRCTGGIFIFLPPDGSLLAQASTGIELLVKFKGLLAG